MKYYIFKIFLIAGLALCPVPASADEALYTKMAEAFDADRAFADLEAQVEIGPRHPGSPGQDAMRVWMADKLREAGWHTWEQSYEAPTGLADGEIRPGYNVIGELNADAEKLFVLSAHWDSREFADSDPDEANRKKPVPAANDGGSGVSALLEMARVLGQVPPPPGVGIAIVLYDFEDQGRPTHADEYALGSKFFAENTPTTYTISAAVNLDMVADKDLEFRIERYSKRYFKDLVNAYWSHGEKRFPANFSRRRASYIWDDHVHLALKGTPSINVIDFSYPPWHTLGDLPEACSPESLRVAGLTSLSFIAFGGAPVSP